MLKDTMDLRLNKVGGPSSRILLDIPCKVCQDHSSGKHYGIFACDGCAGFFKRSIRRNRQYTCKSRTPGQCVVDKTHRNQCRACRLNKCVQTGMNKDAVQHERGPRNSTIRRQMSLYLKENGIDGPPSSPDAPPPCFTPPPPTAQSSSIRNTVPPHMPMFRFGFSPELLTALRPPMFCAPTPKYPHEIPSLAGCITAEVLSETAARLLFMNVKWAKHVPAFSNLPLRDQLLLLEEGWRELFMLSATQFLVPLEFNTLMSALGLLGLGTSDSSDKTLALMNEVRSFHDVIQKFRQMSVDPTEYACLKAVVLFKTEFQSGSAELRGLRDFSAVNILQDQAQLALNNYISTAYPQQPFRFGKLLLLLPSLRSVSGETIADLFFRKTIGSIPIDRLICDMYKSNDL